MRLPHRLPLCLEQLEDRCVPANHVLSGSTLAISPSAGETSLNLLVQQVAPNRFTVTDNGRLNGTFNGISSLNITGTNGSDSIAVDVNGLAYTGNIVISSGNGGAFGDDVQIGNSSATPGRIGGNVTILLGLGSSDPSFNQFVWLGAAGQLAIGGSVQITDNSGFGTVFTGNNPTDTGDLFPPGAPGGVTTIGRDLTITGFQEVSLGDGLADSVGGSLTIQNARAIPFVSMRLADNFTVGKNLVITEGNGSVEVELDDPAINGTTSITLGDGLDSVALGEPGDTPGDSDGSLGTFFNGNVSVTVGNGDDLIVTGPEVLFAGNLTINVGSGSDGIAIEPNSDFPPVPGPGTVTVLGSVSITAGDGDNQVFVGAAISGNLNFRLGNGDDAVAVTSAPSGVLNWTSGNGADVLALVPDFAISAGPSQVWNVNLRFGSNDDTLILSPSTNPQTLTGLVDGGGSVVGNVFSQDPSWMLLPTFRVFNF